MEPMWVKELREVLKAAGREDLFKVVNDEFVRAQKNAVWTTATAIKGHLRSVLDTCDTHINASKPEGDHVSQHP